MSINTKIEYVEAYNDRICGGVVHGNILFLVFSIFAFKLCNFDDFDVRLKVRSMMHSTIVLTIVTKQCNASLENVMSKVESFMNID